ncbi:MAG: SGNH/GDSL hydrolase family protein, partial [Lachnospiraceae bacterium]|nr:SGNH/GDSL hydrolase family protein [Lachnospiraceae bacterium]
MKKIICLGDSITDADRLFSPNGLGHGYVNQLNTLLNNSNSNTFELVNRGVNGFTVDRLRENVGRDCIDRKPDLTTILIGINDVGLMMNTDRTPQQQKELLKKFGSHYRQLLEQIRQHTNSKIILMEPFIFPRP